MLILLYYYRVATIYYNLTRGTTIVRGGAISATETVHKLVVGANSVDRPSHSHVGQGHTPLCHMYKKHAADHTLNGSRCIWFISTYQEENGIEDALENKQWPNKLPLYVQQLLHRTVNQEVIVFALNNLVEHRRCPVLGSKFTLQFQKVELLFPFVCILLPNLGRIQSHFSLCRK